MERIPAIALRPSVDPGARDSIALRGCREIVIRQYHNPTHTKVGSAFLYTTLDVAVPANNSAPTEETVAMKRS
jgi:hypothetical protein